MEMLECLRCGKKTSSDNEIYICRNCGGKLVINYNYDLISESIDKRKLEKRSNGVWKYKELLPVSNSENMVTLGEGGTPLIKARNLSKELGIKNIWLKNETQNPTNSFKDRPMSVGVSKAKEFGAETLVTASSGNAAASLAAYSARAGLECYAFVPENTSEGKLAQLSIHDAIVIKAEYQGDDDPTYKLMKMGFENFGWHPIPSCGAFNPYQPEGSKTISYEVCEQLGWNSPDWVLIPVGAGTLLSGSAKGYFEFEELEIIDKVPKIVGIQPENCAPLVRGFKENIDPYDIPPWRNPKTVAGGLIDPYPWDADTAIPAIKRSCGVAESVSDNDILSAEKILARTEGIFSEPSGVTGLAGLIRLVENGVIDRSDDIVVQITGGGLKDQKVAIDITSSPPIISPELSKLRDFLNK